MLPSYCVVIKDPEVQSSDRQCRQLLEDAVYSHAISFTTALTERPIRKRCRVAYNARTLFLATAF